MRPFQLPKVNTPGEMGPRKAMKEVSFAKADFAGGRHEHTPVIVFGIAKIRRTRDSIQCHRDN